MVDVVDVAVERLPVQHAVREVEPGVMEVVKENDNKDHVQHLQITHQRSSVCVISHYMRDRSGRRKYQMLHDTTALTYLMTNHKVYTVVV